MGQLAELQSVPSLAEKREPVLVKPNSLSRDDERSQPLHLEDGETPQSWPPRKKCTAYLPEQTMFMLIECCLRDVHDNSGNDDGNHRLLLQYLYSSDRSYRGLFWLFAYNLHAWCFNVSTGLCCRATTVCAPFGSLVSRSRNILDLSFMIWLIFSLFSRGRNKIYRVTLLLFVLSQIGCALAPNITALLIFRFLAGFFGSPTVTNSGASITDIWPQSHRSVPLALFSAASFLGPVTAPTVGGFISQYVSWRWNFWLVLIIGGTIYTVMVLSLPETYETYLLREKARRCNIVVERKNIKTELGTNLTRPWVMLFREPILFSLSLYMALVYGVLYLDFTAYPIVYGGSRGWSMGQSGLSFLGIGLGMTLATAGSPYVNVLHGYYVRKFGESRPEARLPHLILLSWLIPIGLFWFAWTASPPTHWISGILAGVPFGFGLVLLFLGITSYLTDCYGRYAASALAANAVLRSLFGAVFPLFARQMYEKLGTSWATSLLGFLALSMAPLPWVFYRFGPQLRAVSKYHVKTMKEDEEWKEQSRS